MAEREAEDCTDVEVDDFEEDGLDASEAETPTIGLFSKCSLGEVGVPVSDSSASNSATGSVTG